LTSNEGGGGGGGGGEGVRVSQRALSLSHTQLLRQIFDKEQKNSRLGETAKERNGGER
jgi:hypothetical protein